MTHTVASCEQALIKTNKKPIQNRQSKTMFLFKRIRLDLSLTDISSTQVIVPQLSKCLKFEAIRGDQADQRICIQTKRYHKTSECLAV